MVNNQPEMQETCVRSLDPEDPLEKGMATHSNIHAWRIPRTEEPGGQIPYQPSTIYKRQHVTKEFSMLLVVKLESWISYLILPLDWVNSILFASKGIASVLSVPSLLLVIVCGFPIPWGSLSRKPVSLERKMEGRMGWGQPLWLLQPQEPLAPEKLALPIPGRDCQV